MRRPPLWLLLLVCGLLIAGVIAVRTMLSPDGQPTLVVYAFSTLEELLSRRVLPEFKAEWAASTGEDVRIEAIYGPSATLAGQINLGAPADIALLSHASHVTALKVGRVVDDDAEPVHFCRTPMVIVTRPGNPKHLAVYSDLAQADLAVLHPDPRTSGAGAWGVLAVYGGAAGGGRDQGLGEQALRQVWQNVVYLAPSARAAMMLFELGAADALVTYEQDALLAADRGVGLEVVVPDRTIVAEHVAIAVDRNLTRAERPAAEAFIRYLGGERGQEACADYHLRPGMVPDEDFTALEGAFGVDALGGWSVANSRIVQGIWQAKILPELDLEAMIGAPQPGED